MKSPTSYKQVDCRTLPALEDVLWEWLNVLDKYMRASEGEDVGWWYNERASVSLFAGAVWRAGGTAFEEFTTEKCSIEGELGIRESWSGRCDLYFRLGAEDYYAEAKQIWSAAGKRAPNPILEIQRVIQAASSEVRKVDAYDGNRIALVFAAPYLSRSYEIHVDELIQRWIAAIQSIACSAKAWSFPSNARYTAMTERSFFPGVALFIEKVK